MKKIFTLLVVAVLLISSVFAFAACGQSNEDLETVLANGVLRVGMECDYAPFNWTQSDDSNGAVAVSNISGQYANGFDVSVAKEIAEGLDVELEIVKLEWDALIPALQAGTIDAIIAGMSPTEKRKETIDFSANYYKSTLVVVVRTDGNFANATSLDDLSDANIVAQFGTFHAEALEQLRTVGDAQLFDTFPLMISALQAGSIDGYVSEEPVAGAHCELFSNFKYIPLVNNDTGFTCTDDDVAIAVGLRKNSSLTAEINDIINALGQAELESFMVDAVENQPV